ncbi:MAG: hypothetical protein QM781_19580 [Chitinophagaceae bacterium]
MKKHEWLSCRMNRSQLFILSFFLLLLIQPALAQIVDSSAVRTDMADTTNSDEPFQTFLLILLALGMALAIGIGVAGTLLAIFLTSLLVLTGIMSIALLVACLKRSLSAGVHLLITLIAMVIGAVTGVLGLWLIQQFGSWQWNTIATLTTGIIAGMAGGWIISLLLRVMALRTLRRIGDKI